MTQTQDAAMQRHEGNGVTPTQPLANHGVGTFVQNAANYWHMAENLANSDIIPKAFQRKPANVFVALEMANRLAIGPFEAMQNLYVVHGTPAMSAKFMIALANRSQRFKGGLRFRHQGEGDDMKVQCYATDRETGDDLHITVSMAQAKVAGWAKNAKYREIPRQMLSYRAATQFVRLHCPEVTLGMATVDEVDEIVPTREPVESSQVTELQAIIDGPEDSPPASEAPATVVDVTPEPQQGEPAGEALFGDGPGEPDYD